MSHAGFNREMCVRQSCTLKSRENLKAVPSKRLLELWTFLFPMPVGVNVCTGHERIRPGNESCFVLKCVLHRHTALSDLSESVAFQVETCCQELWHAQHKVLAHRERIRFGSLTLGLSKMFTD